MITLMKGNLIEADAEALVNSVNCEGYMGKRIALQFKKAFPENFRVYQHACRAGEVQPGSMLVVPTGYMMNPRYIINFPTKRKWREKSRLDDIEAGLLTLVDEVRTREIASIAVPPLGCGLGGLDWREVKAAIEHAFTALPQVRVLLFEPTGAPVAKAMPVRTKRLKMTLARALLIRLMRQYLKLAYRLTLLEVQKLAYFLQESGKPLRLRYVKHLYGPYAHNLNKVIEILDGHFIRGYGDSQAPDTEIELVPAAWFEQSGFAEGEYGVAETLSKAKNTSVGGMVEAGIVTSKGGKVRLRRPGELPTDWDPATDPRLTAWEVVHHLVRVLEASGEGAAAELVAKLGGKAEVARELAYRLYTACERKKRAQEALSYNGLVQSWPEITRLARENSKAPTQQTRLFEQE